MNDLKKAHREQQKRDAEREKEIKKATRHGLFVWRGDGKYPRENRIPNTPEYMSEKVAQKAADILNASGGNVVVRPYRV